MAVKTVPRASRDEVAGWAGDELKIRVQAPALAGRANEALCALLAATLGLRRGAVTVAAGRKSRRKIVAIEGLDLAEARRRLGG
jgi:uncharacterized protein (TIGR00251 family)